jgi:hypothetical protein
MAADDSREQLSEKPVEKERPTTQTELGTLSFFQHGSLSGYILRLLLSHFRLRLQPIV